eukprot:Platyproteum_vivax@DN1063_c0_g1_i1.p1
MVCDDGMTPTVQSGDVIVELRMCGTYGKGDIVIVRSPFSNEAMLRRLIGTEYDVVTTKAGTSAAVPKGRCWVEADNVCEENDSREFGMVPMGLLDALAVSIVWPPNRWRWLLENSPKQVPGKRRESFAGTRVNYI